MRLDALIIFLIALEGPASALDAGRHLYGDRYGIPRSSMELQLYTCTVLFFFLKELTGNGL